MIQVVNSHKFTQIWIYTVCKGRAYRGSAGQGLNSFEKCKIKMKISTLHDRRSMVIFKHQIDFFCNQFQYGFLTNIVCTKTLCWIWFCWYCPLLFWVFGRLRRASRTGGCVNRTWNSCLMRLIKLLWYFVFYRKMPIKEYHYDKILEELGLSKEEVTVCSSYFCVWRVLHL